MEALILSCGTGGGHNAAAEAIRQEFVRRGDRATVLDPYTLGGSRRARQIDRAYIAIAQNAPRLFGLIYALGDLYRRLPWRSPVYLCNRKAAARLSRYLADHPADVLIATHLFPAEIFTQMKAQGMALPKTVFVATDYTCIPFTEETDCDLYIIGASALTPEFLRWGIPQERLLPLGIPVRPEFAAPVSKAEARRALGLEPGKRWLLLSGGSIGAGALERTVRLLLRQRRDDLGLIVLCGSHERLYKRLEKQYARVHALRLLRHTDRMALYLQACDLYLTKPGGLCSTEAAVLGARLVLLPPIPGCETRNARFFENSGMALTLRPRRREMAALLERMEDETLWADMAARRREIIPPDAAQNLWRLLRQ